MTGPQDVWAVIVTHSDTPRAGCCAASLGLPADRVVIVANLPTPESSGPWTTVSPSVPQGYGANINLGAAQAPPTTRWLLLANDDVVFEPGTLERLLAVAAEDSTLGAVTPALYGEDRRPQVVAFRHPTLTNEFAGALVGPEFIRRTLRRGHYVTPAGSGVTYEEWILGAAVLVRFAAFTDVGGFDERYFMYSEDTQLGLDLERAGWRSAVLHDAWALHVGATSTSEPRWSDMLAASRRRYLRYNWSRRRLVALCVLWVFAQGWNAAYVLARLIAHPGGRAERATQLRAHWRHPPWRCAEGSPHRSHP